jgi:hypothetical protein
MSRYAAAHATLKGPGDARPTALQIVEDEDLTNNLTDKVFLVTGVSSGIGIETLRAMYATGAHVIGTVRNLEKGKAAVEEIERNTPSKGKITLVLMDNASLESVRKAAAEIKQLTEKLNVAIFNAGYVPIPPFPSLPFPNPSRLLLTAILFPASWPPPKVQPQTDSKRNSAPTTSPTSSSSTCSNNSS